MTDKELENLWESQVEITDKPIEVKSDVKPPKYPELDAKIREHIHKHGKIDIIYGFYGDGENASAYVEEVIYPVEGGVFTKGYGCPYLLRGKVDAIVIDATVQAKRMLRATMDLIFELKAVLMGCLILCWPMVFLFRKRIIMALAGWLVNVFEANVDKKKPKFREYSIISRQIILTARKIIDKYFAERLWGDFRVLIGGLCVVVDYDNAYGYRLQDWFLLLNKNNLKKAPIREIIRIFNIAISREHNIPHKWKKMKWSLVFLMLFPSFKRIVVDFFLELDLSKFEYTEADFYFNLNRRGYDILGIPFEERYKEFEKLVKEKNIEILGI